MHNKLYSALLVYWQIQSFAQIMLSVVSLQRVFVSKCQAEQSPEVNVVYVVVAVARCSVHYRVSVKG